VSYTPRARYSAARTYTKAQWDEAQRLWQEGGYSEEWREWRHLAAMKAGIIYPPEGTRWDSWDDELPSQRAILVRAIRDTPKLLAACIPGARSWFEVIERLLRAITDWREDVEARERDRIRRAREEAVGHREAVMTIGEILGRVADSAGVER